MSSGSIVLPVQGSSGGVTSINGDTTAAQLIVGGTGISVATAAGTTTITNTGSGSGTVTSVDVSGGATGLTTSGGPVTTSGTITIAGTLAIASGGTGQVTANAATNALLPSQTGNAGKVLTTDGTDTSWMTTSGTGTVTSVDVSGGTTGLTTSGGPVTGSGTITLAGTLAVANGGTNSTAALNNNRVMVSSGGAIVEEAAITANRALASDASGLPVASATTATELGFVSGVTSSIQTQLNGKQATLTLGNLTDAGTDGIVVTGGTGAVVGSGTSIAQHVADATHNGYLSSTDWSTFNTKQAAGNYITDLTGDVSASGPGSVTATIPVGTVTDAKGALAVKPAVTVVATSNQALTGTPTIDGVSTAVGSIVLLTAQTSGAENGPWVVAAGAWSRPSWYTSGNTTQAFQFITTFIRLGTLYQGTTWRQTAAGPITIDTTATTWSETPLALNSTSVTGKLPIANGGTNSSVALNNNRIMISSAGMIVEDSAITANRALASDANGIPVASATTDTELGFVSGVTSAIQTQINKFYLNTNVSSSPYTVLSTDSILLVDTTSARTLNLPNPATKTIFRIKDISGSAATNNITLHRFGSETIEGLAADYVMQAGYGEIELYSDSANWWFI